MRVLFDNGTLRGVAAALAAHSVEEARSCGWDTLKNGELLDVGVGQLGQAGGRPIDRRDARV